MLQTPPSRSFAIARAMLAGLVALVLVGAAGRAAEAVPCRIGGTGAALGGMQLLADAFMRSHPGTEIVVLPSLGSGGGIKALRAGAIDIAVSSRPPKDAERAPGMVDLEYARTPFVFATRADNPISSTTVEQLAAIYRGDVAIWPDDSAVRLVLRPPSESDTRLLRRISPTMDGAVDAAFARPGMLVAVNDQENADALERTAGTLGGATLGQILAERRNLKPLILDGVAPTIEALAAGRYRWSKRFHLIVGSTHSGVAADFVSFLRSPSGHEILKASGHLPMTVQEH